MNNLEKLDQILLSNNVVDNFYNEYNNDKEFSKWLNSFLPEIEQCEKQEQDNPWHKYNVLGHILHSVDAMNNQTKNLPYNDQRLLAYTMFLHDIGKPACHIRRMKNGRMIDSFFDHNIESEKVAERCSGYLDFNKEEGKILSTLVRDHDIFMYIKSQPTNNPHWKTLDDSVIDNEIERLNKVGDGAKLMRYLVKVGRSDNMAQNEKMTAESLELLDKFDNMLDERESENSK